MHVIAVCMFLPYIRFLCDVVEKMRKVRNARFVYKVHSMSEFKSKSMIDERLEKNS